MACTIDRAVVARLADQAAVKQAGQAAADLVALWPLNDALQLDNDAKYAENLQVRTTRAFAQVMTGEDVTVADAEYVYEGADAIPGRPQTVVDALLAANDAYDLVDGDEAEALADGMLEAADVLHAGWSDATKQTVTGIVHEVAAQRGADESQAQTVAAAVVVCDALLTAVDADGSSSEGIVRALPVVLAMNALRDEWALPRLFLSSDDIRALLTARAQADDTLAVTVDVVCPLAAAEWRKHREDVLWNPSEAKQRAKEEDEQRSKAELAAKFAHIPEEQSND